jgi:hypothetical protein
MAAELEAPAVTPLFVIRRAALKPLHAILVAMDRPAASKSLHADRDAVPVLPAEPRSLATQLLAVERKSPVPIRVELLFAFARQSLTSSRDSSASWWLGRAACTPVSLAMAAIPVAAILVDQAAVSKLLADRPVLAAVPKSLLAVPAMLLRLAVQKSLAMIPVQLPLAIAVAASESVMADC